MHRRKNETECTSCQRRNLRSAAAWTANRTSSLPFCARNLNSVSQQGRRQRNPRKRPLCHQTHLSSLLWVLVDCFLSLSLLHVRFRSITLLSACGSSKREDLGFCFLHWNFPDPCLVSAAENPISSNLFRFLDPGGTLFTKNQATKSFLVGKILSLQERKTPPKCND